MVARWSPLGAVLLLLASASPGISATARERAVCRERCAERIEHCVADTIAARPGRSTRRMARRCRRAAMRSCLRAEPGACVTSSPTTTTLPPPDPCPGYVPVLLGRVWQGARSSCEMSCSSGPPEPCPTIWDAYPDGIRFAVSSEECGRFYPSEPVDAGFGHFLDQPGPRIVEPAEFLVSLGFQSPATTRPQMMGVLIDGVIRDARIVHVFAGAGCAVTTRFEPLVQVPTAP